MRARSGLILAAAVIRSGIWAEPDSEALRRVAVDPWSATRLDAAEFRARNWLGPLVAWLTRATSPTAFFILHLILGLLAASLWMRLVSRDARPEDRWPLLLVLAATPGLALPFFWVGNDAVTLLLLAGLVMARRSLVATGILAVLVGLNHFEHGLVVLATLTIWDVLRTRRHRAVAPALASLVGLSIGRTCQNLLFDSLHAAPVQSRLSIAITERDGLDSVRAVFFLAPLVAWSLLGLGTVVILVASPLRLRLACCLALAAAPALIAFDQTRVFAITSLPVTVVALIESRAAVAEWVRRHRTLMIVMFVVTPWLWLDSWKISGSATPYTLLWILDRLIPGFELSTLPR